MAPERTGLVDLYSYLIDVVNMSASSRNVSVDFMLASVEKEHYSSTTFDAFLCIDHTSAFGLWLIH